MKKIKLGNLFSIVGIVLIALLISFIIIFIISDQPFDTIENFIFGPFSSFRRFGNMIEKMIPLIFTGLAASVMFQAKQFSLVADGSFVLGGLFGTVVALNFNIGMPFSILIGLIVGAVIGAVGAFIPAFLKAKWQANEFVVSMMQNSIIVFFSIYILLNVIRDASSGYLASFMIPESYKLPVIVPGTRIHFGLIIALLLVILVYILIYKTKLGYSIRMVGYNKEFAKYSGINIFFIMFIVQIIGGILAGIGGTIEIFGMYDRYLWQASPGLGFDGMTVAILAANNPVLVPIGALFIAYIRTGAEIMARTSVVPNEMVYIIQGIIMILVTAKFLYKKKRSKNDNLSISKPAEVQKGAN